MNYGPVAAVAAAQVHGVPIRTVALGVCESPVPQYRQRYYGATEGIRIV